MALGLAAFAIRVPVALLIHTPCEELAPEYHGSLPIPWFQGQRAQNVRSRNNEGRKRKRLHSPLLMRSNPTQIRVDLDGGFLLLPNRPCGSSLAVFTICYFISAGQSFPPNSAPRENILIIPSILGHWRTRNTMIPSGPSAALFARFLCGIPISNAGLPDLGGKTTLLKKVCMSVEDPEIFDSDGKKVPLPALLPSGESYPLNPNFIFHDSLGFESGSAEETNKVKDFIARRAATGTLQNQLHAIWYCLPSDTNRPLLKADEDFFDTDIRGKVPVIAIFTKFDGLAIRAFQELKGDGYNRLDAQRGEEQRAEQLLTTDFIEPLKSRTVPPSDYLHLAVRSDKWFPHVWFEYIIINEPGVCE
ncbi:hypothetical protein B0H16DRAFT_1801166 [Mycena metata]|uniref:G domain-containing protein n=1 Tax=Mycena metata TaxID=1033252 RepID=A0AAD7NJI5_9AGAR|nr:hypothetical protein B0H16DRAFT_1801166 [Mycena metata]